jgi:hypothetical protein
MKRIRNDTCFTVIPTAQMLLDLGKKVVQVEPIIINGSLFYLVEVLCEKV